MTGGVFVFYEKGNQIWNLNTNTPRTSKYNGQLRRCKQERQKCKQEKSTEKTIRTDSPMPLSFVPDVRHTSIIECVPVVHQIVGLFYTHVAWFTPMRHACFLWSFPRVHGTIPTIAALWGSLFVICALGLCSLPVKVTGEV